MSAITFANKVNLRSSIESEVNKLTAENVNEIKASVNAIYDAILSGGQEIIVQSESDLPAVVNGYHQIPANTVLNFKVQSLTLTNGLEFLGIGMIKGSSSETTFLNGNIENQSFIKSSYSLPIQNISFTVNGTGASVFELDGDGSANAYDWYFVNTFGNAKTGTIGSASNFIVFSCAFFNTGAGLTFNGTVGTIAFNQVLWSGQTTDIVIDATCVITRRFRIIYSSFVTLSGNTSLNVSTSATIPVESYILDTVNFAGGGTYISGVQHTDNKALFQNCKGISNSAKVGGLYMQDNATPTIVSATNTYYKILGTSTALDINQKFTHSNNRLTYVGAITETFGLSGTVSVVSGNNNLIGVVIFKNGVEQSGFEAKSTANSGGRAENIAFFWVGELSQNDYIELYCENYTAITNITAESLFYNIRPVST